VSRVKMPPQLAEMKTSQGSNPLDLGRMRQAIPAECFEKSPLKATLYGLFDYGMIAGSAYSLYTLWLHKEALGIPDWQMHIATLAYWLITGFFMWCIFVVGHDCGHGTFSNSVLLNDVVGHIVHGSIMVPFYPWQVSRQRLGRAPNTGSLLTYAERPPYNHRHITDPAVI